MKKQIIAMLVVLGTADSAFSSEREPGLFEWASHYFFGDSDQMQSGPALRIEKPHNNRSVSTDSNGTPKDAIRQRANDAEQRAEAAEKRAKAAEKKLEAWQANTVTPNEATGSTTVRRGMSFPENLWGDTPPSSPIRAH